MDNLTLLVDSIVTLCLLVIGHISFLRLGKLYLTDRLTIVKVTAFRNKFKYKIVFFDTLFVATLIFYGLHLSAAAAALIAFTAYTKALDSEFLKAYYENFGG